MPRNSIRLAPIFALLLVCQLAPAQKFQPKTIQFKGGSEYSDKELLAAANLKLGTTLTAAEMNEHSKLLMDSGVFDGLTYKFDGVDLVYIFTVAPLYTVHLDNLPLTSGAELDARIHAQLPLYHGKVPAEGTLLDDVIKILQQALADERIYATVTATPSGTPGTRHVTAMSFSIPDPPVKVGAIEVRGASPEMAARIKRVADHAMGAPFSTDDSTANLEHAFSSYYADDGYAAAKVHAERAGDLVVDGTGVNVPFVVTVEEGHLYKLGSVHLPADSLLTQAEVEKMVTQQTSATAQMAAPSKGAAIRGIWAALSARYKSKGYLDCSIVPHPAFDEAASVVSYTVEIKPGPIYHLGLLRFDNVSEDLKKLLMRNWQMMPGDPFDEEYVSGFLIAAQKSDPVLMRTLANVKPTYTVMADPQTHEVNCVIKLERIH